MNIYLEIFIFFLVGITIYFAFFHFRQKKLSSEKIAQFHKFQRNISLSDSYKEKILEYDKLYHKILLAYGYK